MGQWKISKGGNETKSNQKLRLSFFLFIESSSWLGLNAHDENKQCLWQIPISICHSLFEWESVVKIVNYTGQNFILGKQV